MTKRLTEAPLPHSVGRPAKPVVAIPPPSSLVQPLRAQGERVELAGRRVRAVLSGTEGILWLEGDGTPLVASLLVEGISAANLALSPRTAHRECYLGAQGLTEAVQIPEALPGVVLQWQWGAGGAGLMELPIRMELLPHRAEGDQAPLQYHREPGLLWVGQGSQGVLVVAPDTYALPLLRRNGMRIEVEWDLPRPEDPDAPTTLLIQRAVADESWTSLTALAGVVAHHRRGEDAALGLHEPGLQMDSGVEELDDGVRWARSWIRDRLLAAPKQPPSIHRTDVSGIDPEGPWTPPESAAGWLAMAAAASGDWAAGRGAVEELSWTPGVPALVSTLALARWTAWTGLTDPLRTQAVQLAEAWAATVEALEEVDGSTAVLGAILAEVVAAGEAAEVPALANLQRPQPAKATSVRLPTLGGPAPAPTLPSVLFPFQEAHSAEARLDQVQGLRQLLGLLARGAHELRGGRGLFAVQQFVEGTLGVRPDATFSRVTLSPLLPPHWTTFSVAGIRTGEGSVGLRYEREEDWVRWTLKPEEGSVPLMAIFEPWQPLRGVREVRVDGAPAELDLREEGSWTMTRIQIPVDGVRTVEIEGEAVSLPPATPLPE